MLGFFIKKSFFDAWDNLIGLVLGNLGYIVVLILFTLDLGSFTGSSAIGFGLTMIGVFLMSFHSVGIAQITYGYSNYKRLGFAGYKEGLRLFWRHAILLFVVNILLFIMILVVIPFYMNMANIVSLVLSIILMWVVFTTVLAIQYFLPLMTNFTGDKPVKTFKKCYIMAIGNLGTTVFLLIYNIIQIPLTILTAGLLFNMTGITLACQNCFKLLLLRLDYLEENPDVKLKEVPWDDILYEDRESVGKRTLKGMIFPWKD